jgi:hypothetical protein
MMTEREAQRRDRQRAQALPPPEQRARSIPADKTPGRSRRWKTPVVKVAAGSDRRWRRKALADYWGVSERTVDRMRADGRLGEPCGYIGAGRLPIWSDE